MRLSGGQRQRIGIARALYRDADVLILDEATSALDAETERAIIAELRQLPPGITVVMVAHRHSTLVGCDVIYKVQDGHLTLAQVAA